MPNLDVRNDRAFRNMVATLDRQAPAERGPALGDVGIAPRTAGTYLDRGILFLGRGDFSTAIMDFTDSIRLNPTSAAYFQRGYAHARKGDYVQAIADYTQAITRSQ